MTKQEVKNNIDADIRLKTTVNSISPENVGKNMKDIVDLIPDLTVGPQGPQGIQGPQGNPGQDGDSVYEVAVQNGFTGTVEEWLQTLVGPPGADGTGGGTPVLPTPQIAKRKVFIPDGKVPPANDRERLEAISTRNTDRPTLLTYNFPDEYYKEQFDIYFNSFTGNTNNWLSLPDKQVELCMVSNKSYKKINGQQFDPGLIISGKGNKDNFHNAIVHPANSGYDMNTIQNTIYSGGVAKGSDNFPGIRQTEWKLDETSLAFGGDGSIGIVNGLNKLNNPNITIEIDIRDFFQIKGRNTGIEELLSYPMILDNSDGFIRVKKIGDIKFNTKRSRVYKRNSILFFRLSAGLPESYNAATKVYEKRIFSDLSQPIYITPKIGNFQNDLGDYGAGYKPFIFGHITKIGSK